MYILLSPTKTMIQPTIELKSFENSKPYFKSKAKLINSALRKLSKKELQNLMKLSDNLADETYCDLNEWGNSKNEKSSAVLTYFGTAFKYLNAQNWSDDTAFHAQSHLIILSGLYGLLKPYDRVEKYRLEMGLKFKLIDGFSNLYDFWNQDIINYLNEFNADKPIINLASNEYFKVINKYSYFDNIINCTFLEDSNGKLKVIANHSKAARGSMANFILQNKLTNPEQLKEYEELNYQYNSIKSDELNFVFTRKN